MNNRKQGKKKFILIAAILAIATVITTVFVAQTTEENQVYRTISVVEVSGRVSVVKDGIEYGAYPGMLLQEGHEIITAGDSFVRLVLDDDKYIKLESGSRVVFETLGVIGSGKTRIRLERGAITNELVHPLEAEDEYIVNTPNAVLAVRGTFFRVDLTVTDTGDTKTDILTYGGQVSSQRILPSGHMVEEEVLIEAGYKTTINMDKNETVYVVDEVDGILDATGDGVADLAPILTPDIPDDDMIDIYFAAENGHELFVTAEEAKADLETREIIIEEYAPVYEKAEEVKHEQETVEKPIGGISNTTSASVIADDSQPLAKVEEAEKEDSKASTLGSNSSVSGLIDGVHVHKERKTTIEPTCTEAGSIVVTCRECKETLSDTEVPALGHTEVAGKTAEVHSKCVICNEVLSIAHSYTDTTNEATCENAGGFTHVCSCGYAYTTEIPAFGHTEIAAGTNDAHKKCSTCDKILNRQHNFVDTKVEASCTEDGSITHVCDCGFSYKDEIAPLGHTQVNGGAEDTHTICSVCGEVLSTEHDYVNTAYVAPSCTKKGNSTYTCDCGHAYTEEIAAVGHTEVNGGTAAAHTKCYACNEVLSTAHSYAETITQTATCTDIGIKTYVCACGHEYTEETAATGHTEENGGTGDAHAVCSVCDEVLSTAHSYTETITEEATCTDIGSRTYACDCGHEYTEEIAATGHVEANGGTEDVHSACTTCGEVLSTEHDYVNTAYVAPNCTEKGTSTYTCDCGHTYTEEIAAIGHTEVNGGTVAAHTKCYACNEVLSTAHSITDTETQVATCTEEGIMTHACDCGYEYTTAITATGHTEVNGSIEDVHTKCSVCSEVLSAIHSYTSVVTKEANCEEAGEITHTCNCGYVYTSENAALGHDYVAQIDEPTDTENGREYEACSHCGDEINEKTIVALNTVNFPDENFRAYLETAHNTDGVAGLSEEEIATITSLVLKGDGEEDVISVDGGIYDLTGIEYLTELTELNCGYNANLTALDVSQNTKLTSLIVPCTGITTLNIDGCTELQTLTLDYCTSLTALDISSATKLVELSVKGTNLPDITLASQHEDVTLLDIRGTALSTFAFYKFRNLQILKADATLSEMDLSSCNNLVSLYIGAGTTLETLEITMTSLETVTFEGTTGITSINACQAVRLNSINPGMCPNLETLNLAGTSISSIDLSQNTELTTLYLENTSPFYELNLNGLSKLSMLTLTDCTLLQFLELEGTAITTLDLTGCTLLNSLNISSITTMDSISDITIPLDVPLQDFKMDNTAMTFEEADKENMGWFANLTAFRASNAGIDDSKWAIIHEQLSTNLATLDVSANASGFTTLDVSKYTALSSLSVTDCTGLTSISVSGCEALKELDVSTCTSLIDVDVSGSGLEVFESSNATLKTLDVSNTPMYAIALSDTGVTTLNLDSMPNLTQVNIINTPLTTVTVNNTTISEVLYLNDITSLTSLVATNSTINQVTVEGCTSLQTLDVAGTGAGDVSFVGCPELVTVDISGTNMTQLGLTAASYTKLTTLNMADCPALTALSIDGFTTITSLDVSGSTKLTNLYMSSTSGLTSINVTNAGSESENGLTITITTDAYTTADFTGWDDTYMTLTPAS